MRLLNSLDTEDKFLLPVVHAIGNAGPNAVPVSQFPFGLLLHSDSQVKKASIGALKRKYSHDSKVHKLLQVFYFSPFISIFTISLIFFFFLAEIGNG
jgi:hypothetical protein